MVPVEIIAVAEVPGTLIQFIGTGGFGRILVGSLLHCICRVPELLPLELTIMNEAPKAKPVSIALENWLVVAAKAFMTIGFVGPM